MLIGRFDGADGMKTGFICPSGFNLSASATRNGRTLVAVVLGETSVVTRAENAAGCCDHGFAHAEPGWPTLARCCPPDRRHQGGQHARRL